jgi:excisionase family DNA binding protein
MRKFQTSAEAAERLGKTPRTIRNWVKAGRLSGQEIGDRVLVELDQQTCPAGTVLVDRALWDSLAGGQ